MNKIIKLLCVILSAIFMLASCSNLKSESEYPVIKETDHFIFHSEEQSVINIDIVSEKMEKTYKLMKRNFNIDSDDKINVTLYPYKELFEKVRNDDIGTNSNHILAYAYKNNTINMLSPNSPDYQKNQANSYIHQNQSIIEIMLCNVNEKIPEYLKSGIMLYEAQLGGNFILPALKSAFEEDKFPTIEEMEKYTSDDDSYLFPLSYTFVEYAVEKFGYNKLTEFVKTNDFEKSFGINEADFEKNWKEYVEKYYNSCTFQKETEHFSFYSDGTNMELIDKIANELENNYARITDNYKITFDEKVKITLLPDIDTLLKFYKSPFNVETMFLWGFADKDGVNMVDINGAGTYISEEEFLQIAVHEFTHSVIFNINTNIPPFLSEGISQYETNDDEWVEYKVMKLIKENHFPTIQELNQMKAVSGNYDYTYELGYAFVRYIVEEYGYDKLIELIKNYDIQNVFGISEEDFCLNWIEYLKKTYE